MSILQLEIKRIQKPRGRDRIFGYVLAENSMFKLGVMCYEDLPGGRVFELFSIIDRYDDFEVGRYVEVEGDIGYARLENQEEFFMEMAKTIPVDKYYVSPWNIVMCLIAYVEGISFPDKQSFIKEITEKLNRYAKGWINYFNFHPEVDLELIIKKLKIDFYVKVI